MHVRGLQEPRSLPASPAQASCILAGGAQVWVTQVSVSSRWLICDSPLPGSNGSNVGRGGAAEGDTAAFAWGSTTKGDPKMDPKIVGYPYHLDPNTTCLAGNPKP